MKYIFKILLILKFTITYAFGDVINDVQVNNNNRITKETIITFGNIELGKDYSEDQLNYKALKKPEYKYERNRT